MATHLFQGQIAKSTISSGMQAHWGVQELFPRDGIANISSPRTR